jgi:hypothetical protein
MAFITGQTNRRISNKEAAGYLADIVAKQGKRRYAASACRPTPRSDLPTVTATSCNSAGPSWRSG